MYIRSARIEDLPLLQDLERAAGECFRMIGMAEIADDEPLPLEELARFQAAGWAWVGVDALGADKPVAYLLAQPLDGNLHIEQVSVHPSHARQGLGRRLIDHVSDQAREHAIEPEPESSIEALTLTTFEQVPWNAPYYARCGFVTLSEGELTPGLRAIRNRELRHGLGEWPRVCMRRPVHQPAVLRSN
jgi:GNAT superfamily N-acetyltransferase